MKRVSMSIVSIFAILIFFAAIAESSDIPVSTTVSSESVTFFALEPAPQQVNVEASFVNAISDLMDSDVGYQLDESAAISLVYSPFSSGQNNAQADYPANDIYVGLKFSF